MCSKSIAIVVALVLTGCVVTPRPLTEAEFERRAGKDLGKMFENQEPVTGPITLSEAMARAIKYNLDHRLKMMETALARANLKAVQFEELPRLTASAGYHQRSNDSGGVSQSIQTRTQSLVASTSQERVRVTGEVAVAWNLLDFGISYARAQQQADQVMIAMERRRKVMQNIIQDVRYAWWRAVSAEILLAELKKLMKRATTALARSEEMEKATIQSPRQALEYQRDLLEDIRQLWQLVQQLSMAKTELAALINLKPGMPFHVAIPKDAFRRVVALHPDMRALERLALVNRPELRQEDYRKRVDALEVRKAILRMLPGIEINASYQHDTNTFLFNKSWGTASEAITWNLFQIFSGPAAIRAARKQAGVGDSRRLALSMAVVTQVNLAWQRYRLARKDYELERNLTDVQGRLNVQAEAQKKAGTGDELAQIRSATSLLVARLRQAQAYAEMQNAMGRLFNSLGLDAAPTFVKEDVASLAKRLQGQTDVWVEELNRLGRKETLNQPSVPASTQKQALRPETQQTEEKESASKPAMEKAVKEKRGDEKVISGAPIRSDLTMKPEVDKHAEPQSPVKQAPKEPVVTNSNAPSQKAATALLSSEGTVSKQAALQALPERARGESGASVPSKTSAGERKKTVKPVMGEAPKKKVKLSIELARTAGHAIATTAKPSLGGRTEKGMMGKKKNEKSTMVNEPSEAHVKSLPIRDSGQKQTVPPANTQASPITPVTSISEVSSPVGAKVVVTDIVLRGVYPGRVSASRELQLLVLSGSGLDKVDGVFVNWGRGDKRLHASRVQHLDPGHIALRIKTGTTPGVWTVRVEDGSGTRSNAAYFRVTTSTGK